ncbi:hypothetical protein [Azospirillum rugosum]|uniref:Uncharacterized protein n=1 Tax=Azospirillum rugosum TaxID=416170 RepID=A0ABS4SQY7_9PROT|nr:hypothetical protein [Azospirillum rugosum]MBP2294993.1 hypothetical protein [Azospirillum rugosum]MDQ0528816.1 hypothetical protein [Azospirillum rugosum]
MPYTIQATNAVMAISEREYGTAQRIQFTQFTSCIGVLGVVNGEARGVHLSISDQNQDLFDAQAVEQVVALFPGAEQIKIIGQIALWTNPDNRVSAAYDQMVQELNVAQDQIYPMSDGVYGAEISEGELQLTFG